MEAPRAANRSWSDNEGVSVLSRLAESLAALADAVPARRDMPPAPDAPVTDLPIQDLPAHIRFARIWAERRARFLARHQSRNCPICASAERTTWFYTQDGYRYDICSGCGMIYIPEIVPLSVWDGYFAELPDAREYLQAQMEGTITPGALDANRQRVGRYFSLISDRGMALASARLLDIGTYTGGALKIAAEFGVDPYGIEGLEQAVLFCRERRPELRIAHGHAEQPNATTFGGRFDLVTMWETLEHTADPLLALRNAWKALRPGGLLAMTVPNARNVQCAVLREFCFFSYGGYQGVGHVNLFSPDTLRRALATSGFELIHLETEFGTDWRQVAYYLQHRFDRIYCYRNLIGNGEFTQSPEPELAVLLNWLSPALTRLENACFAGPIILAIARRLSAKSI